MACMWDCVGVSGGVRVFFSRAFWGWGLLNLASLSVFEEDNGLREDNTRFLVGRWLRGGAGLRDGAGSACEADAEAACGVKCVGAGGAWSRDVGGDAGRDADQ